MSSNDPPPSSRFPPGVFLPNGLNTDPPLAADDPTIGNKLNHFCIRVRDPEKSLHFYINLMGMRTVFVSNGGPLTVYFLGYPQTDRHRQDPQAFGKETVPQHTLGLLELYHVHGSETQPEGYYQTGNDPPYLGFCHLGFSLADVPATVQRLKDNGVEVVKDLGNGTRRGIPITDWENERSVGLAVEGTDSEVHPAYSAILEQIAFVKDPDGYLVELVPQKFAGH